MKAYGLISITVYELVVCGQTTFGDSLNNGEGHSPDKDHHAPHISGGAYSGTRLIS